MIRAVRLEASEREVMHGGHPLVTLNVNVDVHVYSHGSPVEQHKLDQILAAVKT